VHPIYVNQTGALYFSQACSEDVFKFFQCQTCDSYRFISDFMDVFSMAGVHLQAEQPNHLTEGQTLLYIFDWDSFKPARLKADQMV